MQKHFDTQYKMTFWVLWLFMAKYFLRFDEVLSPYDSPCYGLLDIQISHRCESYELQRFPQLRRRIEEVVASFLREGLAPAETMIGHLIEMEVTNFVLQRFHGFLACLM